MNTREVRRSTELKCPVWMMTFGDFMSLLVTFFVMLIAFANFEEATLAYMFGSMRGALGASPAKVGAFSAKIEYFSHSERIKGMFVEKKWLSVEDLSAVIPDARMALKRFGSPKIGPDRYVTVSILDEGMAFIVCVKPLFEPGTSDLLPGNEKMLREIGAFAEALANEVKIIGVLDESTVVRSSTARTPWGLGIERAMAIRNGLLNECTLTRDRFGIGVRVERGRERSSMALETPTSLGRHLRLARPELRLPQAGDNALAGERMEIIIVGRRVFEERSPEEIVVRDKWE